MPQPRAHDPLRVQSLSGSTMGTVWSLRLDNPGLLPLEQVRATLESSFADVIEQMSTWEPDSEICRFNRAPPGSVHRLSPAFSKVLACALHWASASGGALDPTAGPLVRIWGFGATAAVRGWPGPGEIEEARARVGWQRLEFDAGAGTLLQPGGLELDLSGIAKGFAVDHASAALQSLGLGNFVLEVGGELRASGMRPGGQPWSIQVEAAQAHAWPVQLRDMSVATSGDRWFTRSAGGRQWSHTIDPRSGQAADRSLASVSVLHAQCMQADALATLLTVLGTEQGMAFAQVHELAVLFIAREPDGRLRPLASPRWPAATVSA